MSLTNCEDCSKHGMYACPRHGLQRATKTKPKKNPLLRKSPINPASDKRTEEKKTWALIKKSMILAQQRTNGHTSCMECGTQDPPLLDLDHIKPSGKGGAWLPSNAMLLCRPCHNAKHRNLPEWSKK